MKKILKAILVSVFAMSAFASCNTNKEVMPSVNPDLVPKALIVALPKAELSRSVEGGLDDNATPEYSNVTVVLSDKGDNVIIHEWADLAEMTMTIQNVVKPEKVQVLVNVPAAQLAIVKAATVQSEITAALSAIVVAEQNKEPKPAVLGTSPYYTSAQQTTYVGLAEGNAITFVDASADIPSYNKAVVVLKSITSRFEIGTITPGTGLVSVEIEKVFFNNYFGTYEMAGSGVVNLGTDLWLAGSADPVAIAPWAMITGQSTSDLGSNVYAFQTFAGNLIPQVIFRVSGVLLKGYQLADGTGFNATANTPFTGKYITINGFKTGAGTSLEALVAHTIYSINALTVLPSNIDGKANRTEIGFAVEITVKQWSKETLTPEIQ